MKNDKPKLLIVPTFLEASRLFDDIENSRAIQEIRTDIHLLISGPTAIPAIYHLSKIDFYKYDQIILTGIAGAWEDIEIGTVVQVKNDTFADIAIVENDSFLPVQNAFFSDIQDFPSDNSYQYLDFDSYLPVVDAITIQNIFFAHKHATLIRRIYHPSVSTMEGAVLAYLAYRQHYRPVFQLRAISNKFADRNKNNWNIHLALDNLKNYLKQTLF